MKKLLLLVLVACAFARQATAAPSADLTLRVAPERDVLYNGGTREVVVQIDLDARREQPEGKPMRELAGQESEGSLASPRAAACAPDLR